MYPDIYVFDYDGTLCAQTDPAVSPEVIRLLQTLREQSKLVLATGRPRPLVPVIPEFPWDAAVYYNGQLCMVGDQIIHQQVLEACEWRCFCQAAQHDSLEFLAFSDFVTAPQPPLRLPCLPDVTGTEIVIGSPLDEPFLYKIITEPSQRVHHLVTRYMPHAQIVKWHPDFWEIVPHAADKFTGVERVLSYMGWCWDHVIAFGDGGNDCPLFRRTCCSVAIGDQCPELVQLATYVAPALDQNGLEWAIRKIMSNRGRKPCFKPSIK